MKEVTISQARAAWRKGEEVLVTHENTYEAPRGYVNERATTFRGTRAGACRYDRGFSMYIGGAVEKYLDGDFKPSGTHERNAVARLRRATTKFYING